MGLETEAFRIRISMDLRFKSTAIYTFANVRILCATDQVLGNFIVTPEYHLRIAYKKVLPANSTNYSTITLQCNLAKLQYFYPESLGWTLLCWFNFEVLDCGSFSTPFTTPTSARTWSTSVKSTSSSPSTTLSSLLLLYQDLVRKM